jgi:hypothetical protein
MRGHRLPQLQCVDDDLYQLMLQCWQLDLDERPTFQEITHVLENMLEDTTVRVTCRRFSIKVIQSSNGRENHILYFAYLAN